MTEELQALDDNERYAIVNRILKGCEHLYTKGHLQDGRTVTLSNPSTRQAEQVKLEDKLTPLLNEFAALAEKDPEFLARFTSYAFKKLDSKDLKVVSTFVNFLNDADGTPFSPGSKYKKPNFRIVSQAALQQLDPKMVERVVELASRKMAIGTKYREGRRKSPSIVTGVTKYVRFREVNPKSLEGIKKIGFSKRFQKLYRFAQIKPSEEAAKILGWKQGSIKKGNVIRVEKKKFFAFEGLTELQVAEKIRNEKIPALTALSALNDVKLSPVIAAAIFEQASGDQVVILRALFDEQGLLKYKEIQELFKEKIKTAKTALDRVERINSLIDPETTKALKEAKSEKRKNDMADVITSAWIHIDRSGSMDSALTVAKNVSSIIAEAIPNPQQNFHWGLFYSRGQVLASPPSFEKDAFMAALYGVRADGGTDCLALWVEARKKGCEYDFFITDGDDSGAVQHMVQRIEEGRRNGFKDPKSVVIIKVGNYRPKLEQALKDAGIPVVVIEPSALTESALVSQVIKMAAKGKSTIVDEIMATDFLKLPDWWAAIH